MGNVTGLGVENMWEDIKSAESGMLGIPRQGPAQAWGELPWPHDEDPQVIGKTLEGSGEEM